VPELLFIPWFKLTGWEIPGIGVEIQPFGLLVATGVLLGARVAEWRAEKLDIKPELVSSLVSWVVIIGFVLGHVFDTLFYYPEKLAADPWALVKVWTGLSSFGGFFGAVFGAYLWRWRNKMPVLPIWEQIAFGMPVGWFFGRMGCFVVHDHPGAKTDFFLGVEGFQYPGLETATRHDLGLYEVIWSAAIMLLFIFLNRKPRPHGFFLGWIAILYAPVRFGLDFLREADRTYSGLTPGHYSAFVVLALGVWTLWWTYYQAPPVLPKEALISGGKADS
jgi:phosphatidylglycerol:prolipoprotein diacylglycerol transferase